MADNTNIEWTDATWNPITGCTLVSEGCRHCYAATLAATRLKHHPSRAGLARINAAGEAKFTGEVRFNAKWLDQPLRWRKPRRIFVCAHGDLFHESVPDEWIDKVFAVMALCPQHTFQVLTKRPDRMREYVLGAHCDGARRFAVADAAEQIANNFPVWDGNGYRLWDGYAGKAWDQKVTAVLTGPQWPMPNVWLGASIEDQTTADERIPLLLTTPAAVRFVSAEPLLGSVDLRIVQARGSSRVQNCVTGGSFSETSLERLPDGPRIDWLIVGGESGPHARPMHPDWVRSMRDQCQSAGVPFFFKQWGEWVGAGPGRISQQGCTGLHGWGDGCYSMRTGKRAAGRLLDGREWNEMPEDKSNG
ncbi:phage Gp37/Gp68 family protein [Paenirhodobacter sp. CAU 1674]|uniref:DUF5131 family protein n=1 Tax=Paenirhodobacter sp. CAU 1674 TaxID=3032596 RepID=UPI0023D9BA64|nr:phage Gp37/Gp68 family protein [Paenirhodobacter sp. CAU 1674]MDF2140823.1 phage Gp37/Gp68 family protein [Paenirhodobacter sp. CAU 1674]